MGKSIRVYLANGSVAGVRHAEIVNWTGQGLSCPRTRLTDLKEWPESQRPGVYFLLGQDEESGQDAVYIGEAENVGNRLQQHTGKEFWNECIFFTSKDDLLTKAHVKYLESKLVTYAGAAGRYKVKNQNCPPLSALPRSDQDAMDEYIPNIKVLLGVLGHRVLDAINSAKQGMAEPSLNESNPLTADTENQMFYLSVSGLTAKASRGEEGIVVLAGSQAASQAQPSLANGVRKLRQKLNDEGVIAQTDGAHVFIKDYLFNSPSQAASAITGSPINGRSHWKTVAGVSYAQIEDEEAKSLASGISEEIAS